jgi:CBS domain-containing protein
VLICKVCTPQLNCCDAGTTVEEALTQMHRSSVEKLVVLAGGMTGGGQAPVGIITSRELATVTDRALSTEEIAGQVDPACVTVGEMAGGRCIRVSEDMSASQAMELMRMHGLRHLLVVDALNFPIGIVCANDLVLAGEQGVSRLTRISFYLRTCPRDRAAG